MRGRHAHAPKQRTLAEIQTEMDLSLYQMRDEAFAALTLEALQRRYSRLRPDVVAAHLEKARRDRGVLV